MKRPLIFCLCSPNSFEQILKSALPPSHLGIVQINLPSALGLASVQLVAPRQTCLRGALCDSHCCYATTIINQIAVAQINLAAAI